MRGNETKSNAVRHFGVRNRDLMNAQSPHKWWSTPAYVCCVWHEFVIITFVGGNGELVCESIGRADLLTDHFDGKQSRAAVVP